MASKKINCPLVESEIDDEICFDIHMNVEGLAPDWTIPDKVIKKTDYKNVCEYYGAAEPPVRCGESHLSGLTEPPQFVY